MPKRPRATCQVNPKSLYLLGLDYVPSRKLKGRFGRDASDGVFYQSNSDSRNKHHNVAVAQKKKSIAARLQTQMLGQGLEVKKGHSDRKLDKQHAKIITNEGLNQSRSRSKSRSRQRNDIKQPGRDGMRDYSRSRSRKRHAIV